MFLAGAEDGKGNKGRAEAVKKLCQRLGIGAGRTIADIGCGGGVDTMVFASIVGSNGTVFAEDIGTNEVKNTLKKSVELQYSQVVPVLGHTEDPRLPNGSVDLAFMRLVFHHFTRPHDMLRNLWLDLKPGGYLVIVDREKGPLKQWVETDTREKKHAWTGETTVVRQAREAGFLFSDVLDDLWFEKEPFVLVFQKPWKPTDARGDPDLPLPINEKNFFKALLLAPAGNQNIAFIGLDRGRALLPALQQRLAASARLCDIVIEEWAMNTNEVPVASSGNAGPAKVELLRTINGGLKPPPGVAFDQVIFADAYHRLWDPAKLLVELRQALTKDGVVVVLDRKGPKDEPRRLAGHRRRIAPETVIADLEKAGFALTKKPSPPATDRFLLIFR
jgi:ubiquinone/menaquinone biosynthesis C-methylase UbiE